MRSSWRAVGALASAVVAAQLAIGALVAAPASAAPEHHFLFSFGSFEEVQGVAVDQANDDVFVYDSGAKAIYKFDASGGPAEFSGTGSNEITGVPSAGEREGEIAVASAGPAAGDIYVVRGGASGVVIYSEAGTQIGKIEKAAGVPWGETCGVAVDPQGNVYVGVYEEDVNEYTPTTNPVTASDYVGSIEGAAEPCNVALDSAGDVFAIAYEGPVWRYEASQFGAGPASGSKVAAAGGSTLAVDWEDEEVYVDEGDQISQFGPRGEPFMTPQMRFAASGLGAIEESFGIAVDGESGDVYVSDGQGAVSVFGPALALPLVTTGGASGLTTSSATLAGTVNPEEVPLEECLFEYGETEALGSSVPCAESLGEIGSGSKAVTVEASLSGLSLGTEYHYRLVAINEYGSVSGKSETFTTTPGVGEEFVSGLGATGATLEGSLEPSLQSPARYRFLYGLTSAYEASAPAEYEYAPLAAGNEIVTQRLAGLQPHTTYHFALAAVNRDGDVAVGADQTFTTSSLAPPSISAGAPIDVGQTSVTLTGAIDAQGLATTYSYEYGPTSAYGSSWPIAGTQLGAGSVSQAIAIAIGNLQPGLTYHYRLVASNQDGTTYGPDLTFTTQPYEPSIIQEAPLLKTRLGINPEEAGKRHKTTGKGKHHKTGAKGKGHGAHGRHRKHKRGSKGRRG